MITFALLRAPWCNSFGRGFATCDQASSNSWLRGTTHHIAAVAPKIPSNKWVHHSSQPTLASKHKLSCFGCFMNSYIHIYFHFCIHVSCELSRVTHRYTCMPCKATWAW